MGDSKLLEHARHLGLFEITATGIYAINVRGDPLRSALAASIIRTLAPNCKEMRLLKAGRTNVWVIASQAPIRLGKPVGPSTSLGDVLTDDHAPIQYLVVRDLVEQKLTVMRQ
jgi:hypothetical protein